MIADAPVPVPGLGCIAAGQTVLIHAAAGGTGQAAVNWELVYKYQVHVIGLNIGVLS